MVGDEAARRWSAYAASEAVGSLGVEDGQLLRLTGMKLAISGGQTHRRGPIQNAQADEKERNHVGA